MGPQLTFKYIVQTRSEIARHRFQHPGRSLLFKAEMPEPPALEGQRETLTMCRGEKGGGNECHKYVNN